MKKHTFNLVYVIRLSIVHVSGLVKSTINQALAVKTELGDLGNATLKQLIADHDLFEPTVKNPRKSDLTELVNKASRERKELFAEIKRTVKLHTKGRDLMKKEAAKTLDFFFSTYWTIIKEAMNSVTGVVSGMFEKYKVDNEVQAAARTIGIDGFLEEFEAANIAFNTIYNQRLADDAAHELSASGQKSIVCNSYSDFCDTIEKAANYTPSESILTLFNNMNELRKKYHALEPIIKEKPDTDPPKET